MPESEPVEILLVEDNPSDAELALHALKKCKLANHILHVRDGAEALDFLFRRGEYSARNDENRPVLVLLDLKLPKVDGLQVLKQIKSDPRTKAIPVILLTSSKEESDMAAGYQLGGNSYIQKPVNFGGFTEIVKSGQDIPLILVTGTLGDLKAVECIQIGMADYVLKQQLARLPMAILRAQEAKRLRDAEKEAAAALREGEARFRTLVENAPDAIVVLDMDGGIFCDCNENALRLFRLTREELMRCGPGELSPPFQPDGRHSALAAREWADRATGATPYFGWTHRNSQGEEIPCEVHVVRLPSPTQKLIRGSILNITERKRAEEALRESEARYRSLVNNATYGIYWVTLDGDLLDANPALVQMLGYKSIEELLDIDNTLRLYCDPAARDAVAKQYREHERGDTTVEWKRKNGKIISVRLIGRRS